MPGLDYNYGESQSKAFEYRKRGHLGKSESSQMFPEYDDGLSILE